MNEVEQEEVLITKGKLPYNVYSASGLMFQSALDRISSGFISDIVEEQVLERLYGQYAGIQPSMILSDQIIVSPMGYFERVMNAFDAKACIDLLIAELVQKVSGHAIAGYEDAITGGDHLIAAVYLRHVRRRYEEIGILWDIPLDEIIFQVCQAAFVEAEIRTEQFIEGYATWLIISNLRKVAQENEIVLTEQDLTPWRNAAGYFSEFHKRATKPESKPADGSYEEAIEMLKQENISEIQIEEEASDLENLSHISVEPKPTEENHTGEKPSVSETISHVKAEPTRVAAPPANPPLKWLGKSAELGYLVRLLIENGFIENPNSNLKTAKAILAAFKLRTTPDTLRKELSDTNSLAADNAGKWKVPENYNVKGK
ncbi:hypothetical protein ACTHGU_07040 [Chitinophagaceae bacterium MMS25-I14]